MELSIALVAIAVLCVGVALKLNHDWKPIVQAYLEARCRQAGAPMIVEQATESPGRLLAPFTDDELGAGRDVYDEP